MKLCHRRRDDFDDAEKAPKTFSLENYARNDNDRRKSVRIKEHKNMINHEEVLLHIHI
jgi:hypothetical protein